MPRTIKKQSGNHQRQIFLGIVILVIILVIWLGYKIIRYSPATNLIESFQSSEPTLNPDNLPTYDPAVHKNIIIPRVEGGLGNQLYFISQAFIYAKRFGKTLFLKYETDLPSYGKPRPTYFTSIFRNIPVLKIDQAVLDKFSRVSETELDTAKPGNIYLTGGYFQKPAILVPYLSELRDLFRPTPEIQSSISSIIQDQGIRDDRDIFLHIRLVDDWTPSDFGNIYTPNELDKIRLFIRTQLQQDPATKFILFSNNVDKALELLGQDPQITQAIRPMKYDEITEIYLLAQGRRFIASPSTFMIWGIMLSSQPNKEINILWSTDSNDYRRDFYSQYKPLLITTEKTGIPANNSVTCVSCFYNVGKSKYNTEAYTKWFASTLNIDANYVIFTDLASLELIKPYRQDRNTRYIIKPLDDFTIKAGMLDPKRHIHETHIPSLDVGLIWLNKLEMVKLASERNEFGGEWFMWIDAGLASLRDVKPGGPAFKFENLDFAKFNPAKLYYGQSEANEIMSGTWEYKHNVQGGFFIIHKSSIPEFYQLFQEYFAKCIAQVNNYICLSEQVIWSHILKDNPAIFEKLCDGYGCIINVNNRDLSNTQPPIQESFQNNPSGNIHYYLINLAKNPERFAKFDTQAQKLGIKYTRFNAVYGKDLAPNDPRLSKYIAQPTSLNPGQVGCALSHLTLLEQVMADPAISQDAVICIFEDDVILPNDFTKKVTSFQRDLNAMDPEWRFGLLGVLLCNGYKTSKPGIIQAYPGQHNYGTHAYLVKKRGIIYILDYVSKNKVASPIDDYYINNYYIAGSYIINPVLVQQDRTLASDINVGHGMNDYTCNIKSR